MGYGDIAPQTVAGQTLATIVMIMGYGIIAVPTGIVSVEMSRVDAEAKAQEALRADTRAGLPHPDEANRGSRRDDARRDDARRSDAQRDDARRSDAQRDDVRHRERHPSTLPISKAPYCRTQAICWERHGSPSRTAADY